MTIHLLFAGSGITALPIIFISAFTQLIYIVATSLNLKRKKYSGMFIFSVIYLLLNVYILFLIFPHGDVNYFSLFSILLQNGKEQNPLILACAYIICRSCSCVSFSLRATCCYIQKYWWHLLIFYSNNFFDDMKSFLLWI